MRKNSMLKWVVFSALLGAFILSSSLYAARYGSAGCGFGSVIFGDTEPAGQLIVFTSNHIFSSQITGITVGTSNCGQGFVGYHQKQQENFVAVNYRAIEREMAIGKGEAMEGFAALLGCKSRGDFAAFSRRNHSRFFEVPREKPAEFVSKVKASIRKDKRLAPSCSQA